jgi:hypothetical protein
VPGNHPEDVLGTGLAEAVPDLLADAERADDLVAGVDHPGGLSTRLADERTLWRSRSCPQN